MLETVTLTRAASESAPGRVNNGREAMLEAMRQKDPTMEDDQAARQD